MESFSDWRKASLKSEQAYSRRFANLMDILFTDRTLSAEDGKQGSEATKYDIGLLANRYGASCFKKNSNSNSYSASTSTTDISTSSKKNRHFGQK
jgi:hypothetical protein